MKKLTSIAIASLCAIAAATWTVPASAYSGVFESHDKKPESHGIYNREAPTPTSSVPEPGTMALLALGLGGLGLARRRRTKD